MSTAPPRRGAGSPAPPADLPDATLSEIDGVRYLHLDSPWVQGAMRIRKPLAIELQYVQRMMAWLLWTEPDAVAGGLAVQLGLGAGAITRFTHRVLGMRTVAVEVNPQVVRACRLWFHLADDGDGLAVVRADAGAWVAGQADDPAQAGSVQALCVDLYDRDAAAPVIDDAAFYRRCRSLLADGGTMSVNLFGRHASFADSGARIAAAFGPQQVWTMQPTREGNTVVVATRGAALPERDALLRRADIIEDRWGLPARKWVKMVRPLPPSPPLAPGPPA